VLVVSGLLFISNVIANPHAKPQLKKLVINSNQPLSQLLREAFPVSPTS